MDYRQFRSMIENGESDTSMIAGLQEFISEFPYFQTAHALLTKAMHDHSHVKYEKQLKIAAAYSGDRKVLHDLVKGRKPLLFKDTQPEAPAKKTFVTEEIKKVEHENPFLITGEEPLIPKSELIVHPHEELPEENVAGFVSLNALKEELEIPEIEKADEEKPVADPHDIIRKRLNEILGYAHVQKQEEVPVKISGDETENKEIKNEFEKGKDLQQFTPENDDEQPGNLIDKIADESSRAVDDIDRGELEYALEASLIQSLEKLPVITKQKDGEKQVKDESPAEEYSFIGWLKRKQIEGFGKVEEVHAYEKENSVSEKGLEEVEVPAEENKKQHVVAIIDRFIQAEPRIIPSKTEFYSPATQAKRSVTEDEDLVSETLANIYRQQGNLIKARSAYQKLSLLNPDKLAYFAALISGIDQEINNSEKTDL
jgi:hypothetical protein